MNTVEVSFHAGVMCCGEMEGGGTSPRDNKMHLLPALHERDPCMSGPQLLPGL